MGSQEILILVIVVLTFVNLILSGVALSKVGSKSNYRNPEQGRERTERRHPGRGGRRISE
jgi:hypothetical protein